ncbi:exodeoxyribonuclease V alpha subunit [Bacillus mesophilus]|uniref:ATP-dependent RecD2 DNA helicase n=1 Tax=Bacillus mesophilus TaxID=1808955 RepID=A0A6M0Q5U0_9BACI|nr:ATP-dependent RecD-like DNA helicase [Bacillus mesophilus]MBM7660713.1 exodeoxyribonuclease V alpha subunit [Bacillus mesophilus]NEY71741.1 ATP-dependent RecD-like DNA helicase [Bacillus mesophilus]
MTEPEKYVKGHPIVTIFHNDSNLYTVLRIRIEETTENYEDKEAIVTGYFPLLQEHETYTFFGVFKDHPKFGIQYHVNHFQKEIPRTEQGIILYLSSDLFKGIGKKTAEKIVEALGEDAINKILHNPDVLKSVPQLTSEKAKELARTLLEHQGLEQVMVTLSQYGFGPQLSMKIYQTYRDQTLDMIKRNPYQLMADVEGIGFAKADELGKAIGMVGKHPERIKAACLYVIDQFSMQEGHVYLLGEQLYERVRGLLESSHYDLISESDIIQQLEYLVEEGKLVLEDDRYYLPSLFFSEKGLVTNIKRLLEQEEYEDSFPESEFLLALGALEERLKVQYAPSQKDAIQKALSSPMLLLTGGPGTGKTTVIKGIVELYAELHGCSLDPKDYKKEEPFPFLLVAPTGRAAKRMNESTGLPAVTIHRLLGWNGVDGFDHDEDNPVDGKILIVDEVSMVDTWLANQLFKSLPASLQVILVGDEDQLPSVGPGQVLSDLLDTGTIPTVRLVDIFRQSEDSTIVELAHDIKKGTLPHDIMTPKSDRSFLKCNQYQVIDVVKKVCANAVKKGFSPRDIQVLAPMYRGPAGIDTLNLELQTLFNPKTDQKREISYGDKAYRVGDKVLQLVNQPDQNVFNGDMGEIVSVFYAKENVEKEDLIVIAFEGTEVTYKKQDLNQITHAYCCSVHKAQGSEFPIVIFPVVKSYYRMLRKNLIYTAITRSKEFLILCGEEETLLQGIQRTEDRKRQTTLTERVKGMIGNIVTETESAGFELSVDAERAAMVNVSPYDFMD